MSIERVTSDEHKHSGDVTSIVLYKDHLFSAGGDGKIKVWDKDLNFKRELSIHEAYIYAIVIDKTGRLYSSSCDGTIKTLERPLESDEYTLLLQHEKEIESLVTDENDVFYCGDDHGGISIFECGKFKFMMNIVEHVKGLCVERGHVYSLANMDLSIHKLHGQKYSMEASIPGKFPVALFGDVVDGRSKYIAILTREGMGVSVLNNATPYAVVDVNERLHEMIVNSMRGYGDLLFSCDYAGTVRKSQMSGGKLVALGAVSTGSGCANCIAVLDERVVFVGSSDGTVKRISF